MLDEFFDKDELAQDARSMLRATLTRLQPCIVEEIAGAVDLKVLDQINALPGHLMGVDLKKGQFVFDPQGTKVMRWINANLPKVQIMQTFEQEFLASMETAIKKLLEHL